MCFSRLGSEIYDDNIRPKVHTVQPENKRVSGRVSRGLDEPVVQKATVGGIDIDVSRVLDT
jgi:hypothetical protein